MFNRFEQSCLSALTRASRRALGREAPAVECEDLLAGVAHEDDEIRNALGTALSIAIPEGVEGQVSYDEPVLHALEAAAHAVARVSPRHLLQALLEADDALTRRLAHAGVLDGLRRL